MTSDNERIRQRAYELWQQDGSPDGRHEQHWADAERELSGTRSPEPAPETVEAPDKAKAAPTPRARSAAPKTPRKRAAAKSPLADAGAPGGTGGTGGTFRDQDA